MRDTSDGGNRSLRGAVRSAWSLSPGLMDAALSSLAGFAASLYAVRSLDGSELGAYSLYLAAYVVGSLFAQQLLYLPAQIASLKAERVDRPAILRPTLWRGAAISALAAPFVGSAGVIVSGDVSSATLFALGAGAALLCVVTPSQDHVRSTLYLAGEDRRAAVVSAAQLVMTLGALGGLYAAGASDAWTPFGALALGTTGSMVVGLALTRFPEGELFALPPARELLRTGGPLLPAALVQEATIFVSAGVLASIASAAALGSAEAARIVSRPVQAFSLGVSRSLAPRLMEAGDARSRNSARRVSLLYVTALAGAGVAYLAVAGWSYGLSPFVEVAPAAYAKEGLVALFIVATVAGAIAQVPRGVLLGAAQGRELLAIAVAGAAVRIAAVAALAASIDAYALPAAHLLSLVVIGGLGLQGTRRLLDRP